MKFLKDKMHHWLFNHTNKLDELCHKTFVSYCIFRLIYSTTTLFVVINQPQYFDILLPALVVSWIINPLAIISSKYNFKLTAFVYLTFGQVALIAYLFMYKFSVNANLTTTPLITLTTSIVVSLTLGRKMGFIFFILSFIALTIDIYLPENEYFGYAEPPPMASQYVMILNGIYIVCMFSFISFYASMLNKYYNFYIKEVEVSLDANVKLIETNKNLSEVNCELEEHIAALEDANNRFKKYAWINAHEVRAPLATLMGLSSLLDMNLSEEDKTKTIKDLQKNAQELDQVVKKLNTVLSEMNDIKIK